MIVTEFQLDRFRGGNPLRVLDLGNGLNVALVRSVAGRAQLLNVIPSSFFGVAPFFWEGGHEPDANDVSGHLVLRTDHGVFRIHRHGTEGELHIQSPDGTDFSNAQLGELLDDVGVDEYRDIFTFNLQRLRRLAGQGAEAAPKLVRMASFLKSASQTPVATHRPPSMEIDLSGPEGVLRDLYRMLRREAQEDSDDQPVESVPRDRDKTLRELKRIDAALTDSEQKIAHLEAEIRETECALAINRSHTRLAALERELAELSEGPAPETTSSLAEGSIDRLNVKIEEAKQQLKQLTAERDELARQGKALARDDRFTPLVAQIDSILLQEKSAVREEEAIERLKLKLEEVRSRQDQDRLSASYEIEQDHGTDVRTIERVNDFDRRMREAEQQQEVAEQRLVHAENMSLDAHSALGGHASTVGVRPEDAIALHEAETRVSRLKDRLGHDGRLEQLQLEQADAVAKIREHYREQMLPFQTLMMMGIPFMIGVTMIIYGLTQYTPHANWRVVFLGFLLSAGTALFKMMIDRDRIDGVQRVRARLHSITQQIEEHTVDELSGDADIIRRQLADAEAELAQLHQRMSITPQPTPQPIGEVIPVETARVQMENAQRRLRELHNDWREQLVGWGLAPTLTPAHARDALARRAADHQARASSTSDSSAQVAVVERELELRTDWLAAVAGRLRQLLRDLRLPSSGSIVEQFVTLREAFAEFVDRRQTRRQLAQAIRRIREKAHVIQDSGRRYLSQRKELLSDSDHKSSEKQIQRQMRSQRRKLLEQQRELVQNDIEEIRVRHGIESKTPLAEYSDEELETRLSNQHDKLASIRDKAQRETENRGRLRAVLSLNGDGPSSRVPWNRLLKQTILVREQLRSAARLQVVDDEPMPEESTSEYLSRASDFLRQLSGGQFEYLSLTEDEQDLFLMDDQGRQGSIQQINQNHLPNIYFSLWLARIEAYADRGIRLPIVMEDPLEATRAAKRPAVAGLLAEFATLGHQFVLVTLEQSTAEAFAELGVPIADFSQREPAEVAGAVDRSHASHYPEPDDPGDIGDSAPSGVEYAP